MLFTSIITGALEEGAVDVKVIKCVTLGPPEAGKTQLKHALLGDFTPIKKSTNASTQATPAVEIMVAGEQKWEPLNFKQLQSAMQTTATKEDLPQRPTEEDTRSESQKHTQSSKQERIREDHTPGDVSPSHKDNPLHEDDPLERKIHPSQATYAASIPIARHYANYCGRANNRYCLDILQGSFPLINPTQSAFVNPFLKNVTTECANYTTFTLNMCPAPCKSALRTALNEFGCCINILNDTVNEILLPHISGSVMTACGLDSPGHCKSVLSISGSGSTTASWIYLCLALLTLSQF